MVQCIGLDVHRKMTVACVYNPESHEERYETIPTDAEELSRFLRRQGRCRVALEVNGLAGRLYDRIYPEVDEIQVANPSQTPWIYRSTVKTDRLDAKKLAVLLSVGQLPTVHMPKPEVRAWRAVKDSEVMKTFFERVQHGQKQRKKIAIVAVARKIAVIACAMLRSGETFNAALVGPR